MSLFRRLIERQILKARAEGKLQGLAGEGKPLPDRPGDALIDPAEAAGYRIMAEAGALPQEFKPKAELDAAREEWQAATNADRKKALMAKISDLQMKYEIAREARKKFMK